MDRDRLPEEHVRVPDPLESVRTQRPRLAGRALGPVVGDRVVSSPGEEGRSILRSADRAP
jgi:hypothetical protein